MACKMLMRRRGRDWEKGVRDWRGTVVLMVEALDCLVEG